VSNPRAPGLLDDDLHLRCWLSSGRGPPPFLLWTIQAVLRRCS